MHLVAPPCTTAFERKRAENFLSSTGSWLAGKDGKFIWGTARIEGDSVLVSSEAVSEPTSVRYSWASNPIGNLYNKAGLPASPFRTDAE